MTESADREGMFTHPRLLDSRDPVHGDVMSVVTCTRCGCLVADTEAHQQMHSNSLWSALAGLPPQGTYGE